MSKCQDYNEDTEIINPDDYEDIDQLFVSGSEDEKIIPKENGKIKEMLWLNFEFFYFLGWFGGFSSNI